MEELINQTPRLGWGFSEISQATGLSINFLRTEERRGNLKASRFGRRLVVLTEDLKTYLESGRSEGNREAA